MRRKKAVIIIIIFLQNFDWICFNCLLLSHSFSLLSLTFSLIIHKPKWHHIQ